MSRFTPGPWRTEEQWHGTAIKAGARTVARVRPWSNRTEQANARLLAAAPDLLGACEALTDMDGWTGVATPDGLRCVLCRALDDGSKPKAHTELCPISLARAALKLACEVGR